MRVEINLATQPYEDARRFWMRWGLALAALGMFTLIVLYWMVSGIVVARKDQRMIRQAQQAIADRDATKASAQAMLDLPQNREMRDRSQFLNDAFQRKAFSWTQVFEDLEEMMPPRLHLVSIRPDLQASRKEASDGRVKFGLSVAGDSREKANQLVERMESSQRFQDTQILSETTQQAAAGDAVKFEISAMYVPQAQTQPVRRSAK